MLLNLLLPPPKASQVTSALDKLFVESYGIPRPLLSAQVPMFPLTVLHGRCSRTLSHALSGDAGSLELALAALECPDDQSRMKPFLNLSLCPRAPSEQAPMFPLTAPCGSVRCVVFAVPT